MAKTPVRKRYHVHRAASPPKIGRKFSTIGSHSRYIYEASWMQATQAMCPLLTYQFAATYGTIKRMNRICACEHPLIYKPFLLPLPFTRATGKPAYMERETQCTVAGGWNLEGLICHSTIVQGSEPGRLGL